MVQDILRAIYDPDQIRVLMILIVLDALIGVVVAVLKSQFRLANVADFWRNKAIPALLVYGAGSVLTIVGADLDKAGIPLPPFRTDAYYMLIAVLVADLINNLRASGARLPVALAANWSRGTGQPPTG